MSEQPSALLLAAHGGGRPQAMTAVENIVQKARDRFPRAEVRLCFTSAFVRRLLAQRGGAAPRGALGALAALQEEGFRRVVVQPLHIFAGAVYYDLADTVRALAAIQTVDPANRPFEALALGRPALGVPGPRHPYLEDIARAARALADDAAQARANGEALVYVGHGNKRFSTGVYQELQQELRRLHPGLKCFVGTLDGTFALGYTLERMIHHGVGKALVVPLLLVAGSHAARDICGDGPESWAEAMAARGIGSRCLARGLGQVDAFAELFVENAAQAAAEAGVEL